MLKRKRQRLELIDDIVNYVRKTATPRNYKWWYMSKVEGYVCREICETEGYTESTISHQIKKVNQDVRKNFKYEL